MEPLDSESEEQTEHPNWAIPFWMMLALAWMFVVGCGCGSILTWLWMNF